MFAKFKLNRFSRFGFIISQTSRHTYTTITLGLPLSKNSTYFHHDWHYRLSRLPQQIVPDLLPLLFDSLTFLVGQLLDKSLRLSTMTEWVVWRLSLTFSQPEDHHPGGRDDGEGCDDKGKNDMQVLIEWALMVVVVVVLSASTATIVTWGWRRAGPTTTTARRRAGPEPWGIIIYYCLSLSFSTDYITFSPQLKTHGGLYLFYANTRAKSKVKYSNGLCRTNERGERKDKSWVVVHVSSVYIRLQHCYYDELCDLTYPTKLWWRQGFLLLFCTFRHSVKNKTSENE